MAFTVLLEMGLIAMVASVSTRAALEAAVGFISGCACAAAVPFVRTSFGRQNEMRRWHWILAGVIVVAGDLIKAANGNWVPWVMVPLVEQRSPEMLQRALDALGELPVHVVATTGGIVDPGDLAAPANAHLVLFADHDSLMERASLVVGHGGHGTTMRALRHGPPMVGIPAKGADQVLITQLLEEWKVGRALPGDADVSQIRSAAQEVLSDPSFREQAVQPSHSFAGLDGARIAANSVEAVIRGVS